MAFEFRQPYNWWVNPAHTAGWKPARAMRGASGRLAYERSVRADHRSELMDATNGTVERIGASKRVRTVLLAVFFLAASSNNACDTQEDDPSDGTSGAAST